MASASAYDLIPGGEHELGQAPSASAICKLSISLRRASPRTRRYLRHIRQHLHATDPTQLSACPPPLQALREPLLFFLGPNGPTDRPSHMVTSPSTTPQSAAIRITTRQTREELQFVAISITYESCKLGFTPELGSGSRRYCCEIGISPD